MPHARPALATALLALAACGAPIDDVEGVDDPAPPVVAPPIVQAPPTFRLDGSAAAAPADDAAPFSLTSSDGEGLALAAVKVRGVVSDPLAFTELTLTFQNKEDRVREGRFSITLPDGASLSRFAMKIGDRWQEGEIVEKQAARRAYEDFLHRKQDPALLEQAAGNQFEARVFPIPARGVKELIVSYSHELPSARARYRVALKGLPEIGALDVRVQVGDGAFARTVEDHHQGYVPDADVDVEIPRSGQAGARSGDLVVARITPVADTAPAALKSLLVLVDTSASRALGFDAEVRLVDELLRGLQAGAGKDAPLTVAAFDQTLAVLYEGPAAGWNEEARGALRARRALGASDLGLALKFAAKSPRERVLLVTDGMATAGEAEGDALITLANRLGDAGVQRLDALVVGGIRDVAALKKLTTALPQTGVVVDAAEGAVVIADRLTRAARARIPLDVPGASWFWPTTVESVQAGDQVLVYASLPANVPLRITIDGAAAIAGDAVLTAVERPLLERAIAKARIDALVDERDTRAGSDPPAREALRLRIVELSTKSRVLSPFTALLVLETEADYTRFGIDRRALADVLTVGERGVVLLHRTDAVVSSTITREGRKNREKSKLEKAGDKKADEAFKSAAREGEREAGGGEQEERDPGTVDMPAMKAAASDEDVDAYKISDALGGLMGASGVGRSGGGSLAGDGSLGSARASSVSASAERDDGDLAPPREVQSSPSPPRSPPPSSEPSPPRADPVADATRLEQTTSPSTSQPRREAMPEPDRIAAFTGPYAEVMRALRKNKLDDALTRATAWHEESPGDVLALTALGKALAAKGDAATAARAYGSIIDLFPARADLRRYAGGLLESLEHDDALALALDTHAKAAADRADHPASHHAYAMSLARAGRFAEAFAALEVGLAARYRSDGFVGAREILREDAGLVAAAWTKAEPLRKDEIRARLKKIHGTVESGSSVRFILTWETDANDVDFHIKDRDGAEAYYSQPELPSGGRLYADVTTGYGPECFTVRGGKRAYPYKLEAHYYSRGPMGYGMGRLQIIEHDGKGGLKFADRPFVVMQDNAFVDLGAVRGRLTPSVTTVAAGTTTTR